MPEVRDLRILIIDDNKKIHEDFLKILSFTESNTPSDIEKKLFGDVAVENKPLLPHFQIGSALQGKEGVEEIKKAIKEGQPYALAFVDIRMPPGWDGIETIQHIWEVDPDIQIVICTAYSDYSWEETIELLGQKENLLILKKPFDSIAVRQLAYALTKKWQLLQQSRSYTRLLEEKVDERTSSLQELLSRTRGTLESSADGIFVLNNDSGVVDYNTKFLDIWNIPQSIIETNKGNLVLDYIAQQAENPIEFTNMIVDLSKKPEAVKVKKFNFKPERIFECYSQPYKIKEEITGRVWSFRDISQRIILERKLEYQALHDSLTGLPNRELMLHKLQHALERAKRQQSLFAIIFFDLNRFKLINDSLGHAAGDELLKLVAKRMEFVLRQTDTLARLGGDEFVLIADSINSELDAGTIANRLMGVFKDTFEICGHSLSVSTSAGVSLYPRDGTTISELLRHADAAMYRAKSLGTSQPHFYTVELGRQIAERLELENDLTNALSNDEFVLYYQPQVDARTKKILSVEALIRWQHPKKGLLLPIHFIPIAEETGLIFSIGDWILKTACEQNKRWQEKGFPKIRVAVSITLKQIKQANFAQKIKSILEETGLKSKYLELELSEKALVRAVDWPENPLADIRAMGVNITLGDFGTGDSSINYLHRIPLNRLKIAQSYIKNINLNNSDEVIIQSIITLARKLNLNIVAEGVETQKQLEFLQSNHCEEIQGTYFSQPITSEEMQNLLNK
ncbi:diguanylate cyclase [Legionella norrlandica]|uniref:Diguanylate cyclase n=1 Tax=Legionella norrlandica TaxID=1498499 RepID=A0A0A2ST47_9GAMM|nr:EAL domain-containing protein [Legionella norrlandica]KGP63892.1 diguanylate cyclase [Legionella norrlandica]